MTEPQEVPALTVPREDIFKMAIAMRLTADSLSRIRQRRGRAAFAAAEDTARKQDTARRNNLTWFTRDDTDEWGRAREAGSIYSDRHADTDMRVRIAPLAGGRYGVQAGWSDKNVAVVAESAAAAQHLHRWLWQEPTETRIDGLSSWLTDRHGTAMRAAEVDAARTWAAEHDPDFYDTWRATHTGATPTSQRRAEELLVARMHTCTAAARDAATAADRSAGGDALLAGADRDWADFTAGLAGNAADATTAWVTPYGPEVALSQRLRGRVPDAVLDNPRWPSADTQFRELVDAGADPAQLAQTVSGLDWDSARSPSAFASWAMREADQQARRQRLELAGEWLLNASTEDPRDRADAAELLGTLGDDFDARLGTKFPGLLDSTEAMTALRGGSEAAAAESLDARAAQLADREPADELADLAQSVLAWHGGDGEEEPIAALWPAAAEAGDTEELRAEAVEDRTQATQDREATQLGGPAAAAAAPLTPPADSPTRGAGKTSRTAPAAAARRHTQHRGLSR